MDDLFISIKNEENDFYVVDSSIKTFNKTDELEAENDVCFEIWNLKFDYKANDPFGYNRTHDLDTNASGWVTGSGYSEAYLVYVKENNTIRYVGAFPHYSLTCVRYEQASSPEQKVEIVKMFLINGIESA
jgi:hypothetical protein